MDTIVIKPKSPDEVDALLQFLKENKIEAEIQRDRTKDEILDSIERSAKEAADYIAGKTKLKSVQEFLDEL